MPTSYIELHTSPLNLNYANRVPYEVSGLVYWLDPQRWNDPVAPWTMNGTKVVAAPSRHSSLGLIDATKTVAQGTDSQRPTLNTTDTTYGGRATLSFSSAAAQYLVSGAWASSQTQPTTVYLVGSSSSAAAQRTFMDGIGGSNLHRIATANSTGYTTISAGNSVADNSNAADNEPRVWCVQFNGASSAIYVNNGSAANATGNALTQAPTGLSIGCNFGLANFLDGKLATILIYSGAHTEATRTRIMQWLSDRYGFDRSLTPYTVGGLAYWLDPDRYADPSGPGAWTLNGTKVAAAVSRHSWAGVADTSKNVTQATDGNRPTINVADGAFNGRNTLSLDATPKTLGSSAWTSALVQPNTTYVVFVGTDKTANRVLVDFVASGGRQQVGTTITNGRGFIYAGATVTALSTDLNNSSPWVACATFNGASSALYANDSTTPVASGNPSTNGLGSLSIGTNGPSCLVGKIVCVLIYSGAHTAAQRALIMQWLGSRYGVTVT